MNLIIDTGLFEIAGLPLHPLLVHAAVVLTPLTAIALAIAALWPAARSRMGLALPAAALVVAVLVPMTILAGEELAGIVGETAAVEHHEDLGEMLQPWAIALLPASALVWWLGRPDETAERRTPRWLTIAATLIALVIAGVTLVLVVLTGDAGARAVWGGTV